MRTAAIFSDHMVLQREKPIAVFGDGQDGEKVCVLFCGHRVETKVKDGKWRVTLPPMAAAEGLSMTVQGAQQAITFSDIAIGEVWLCGGQSNMEYEIQNEKNGEQTLHSLTPETPVRFYYTPKQRMIDEHFEEIERNTCWSRASAEHSRAWSAVGLYFALELSVKLGVTVGLIGCNWGGTSASVWVSRDVLEQNSAIRSYIEDYDKATAGKSQEEMIAEFDEYIAYQDAWYQNYSKLMEENPDCTWEQAQERLGKSRYPGPMGPKNECRPCGAYETMLQRVCPYTLRGFLYYQGESDDHRPESYETLLTALVSCWRRDWEDSELPFLIVQLPMFRYLNEEDKKHWCIIRAAQERVYRKLKHTGLAVLTDCGELDNIHPIEKAPVGHRLFLQALCEVYGLLPQSEATSPLCKGAYKIGNVVYVELEHAEEGLVLRGEPVGFELAGEDGVYRPAAAAFERGKILLTAEGISTPVSARYAWYNYLEVTVYGANGLPLAPFSISV